MSKIHLWPGLEVPGSVCESEGQEPDCASWSRLALCVSACQQLPTLLCRLLC